MRVELGDGVLVDVEQVAQRVEAHGIGLGELETVELGLTGRSPQLADDGQDPVLGHDPVDLGLGTGAVPDERIAITHQLAQLSNLWRGDPALGQPPESQHGGQVLGVAHVVLDASVPPVVAERMGQVDVGAEVLEDIGRPVPAIGGFEDHLGLGPGSGHGLGELEGLADEALGAEHLAVFCHPDDGGAVPTGAFRCPASPRTSLMPDNSTPTSGIGSCRPFTRLHAKAASRWLSRCSGSWLGACRRAVRSLELRAPRTPGRCPSRTARRDTQHVVGRTRNIRPLLAEFWL